MIRPASACDVLAAIGQARSVVFSAYVLRGGQYLSALEAAAKRGAQVTVRLEGRPYGGGNSAAAAAMNGDNAAAAAAIRAAGGDAALVDASGVVPLHLKAAVCDGIAYLDDRNWPDDGADTIVRDDSGRDAAAIDGALLGRAAAVRKSFWTRKAQALAGETRLLDGARHAQDVDVESESFGRDGAYAALKRVAARGVHCRLLVARRDLNPTSEIVLRDLEGDGVRVRIGASQEKLAVVDHARAWIGSANATWGYPKELDWGLRTRSASVVETLQARFNAHWAHARPI